MKIWTDDEVIEVDPKDVGDLEAAMLFKAEHIKAKADPELFTAVADMLDELLDVAIRCADVVRCRECKHYDTADFDGDILCGCTLHSAMLDITPDSFCSYGDREESAK